MMEITLISLSFTISDFKGDHVYYKILESINHSVYTLTRLNVIKITYKNIL